MSAAELLETLAELVADKVAARLPERTVSEFVDQGTCGFDAKTFVRCARAGEFLASKVGRRWIARRSDVNAWLDAKRPALRVVSDTNLDDLRRIAGLKGSRRAS